MNKPLVMVVDDDADVRASVCRLLRDDGFAVLVAENGAEALTLLRRHEGVRAILMDVTMPVMNGATFRGEQLEDERIASIPLILMSGRDDSASLARVLGAAACLRKPLSEEPLLRTLAVYH